MQIQKPTKDGATNVALDTINRKKQALMFVSSKRSAEKAAEDLSKHCQSSEKLKRLAEKIRKALSSPTKQCKRLSKCIERGIAFHHSGLASKQRELIEDAFREGTIHIICCTPTLAAGIDMPAFRTIIRDLQRFGQRGMQYIPVLEYLQMAGRAGRPGKEDLGESIIIAKEGKAEQLIDKYIYGEPEEIYSKLAVEPVLRTHILSLVSAGFAKSEQEIVTFFSKTFWAHQFEDMGRLEEIILRVIKLLRDFGFIEENKKGDFVAASAIEDDKLKATPIGRRVAELYLDPLTANDLIKGLKNLKDHEALSTLHLLCYTLEMRPFLRVATKEFEEYEVKMEATESLFPYPGIYELEYQDSINSFKTAKMIEGWIDEVGEDKLLEDFAIRPGELRVKIETLNWLFYGCLEMSKVLEIDRGIQTSISKLRMRLNYGAKEELFSLLRLKQVGRARARAMYNAGIKDLKEVKKVPFEKLKMILGTAVAINVKEQVGIKIAQQSNLTAFSSG